jgi:hypothetical protein
MPDFYSSAILRYFDMCCVKISIILSFDIMMLKNYSRLFIMSRLQWYAKLDFYIGYVNKPQTYKNIAFIHLDWEQLG